MSKIRGAIYKRKLEVKNTKGDSFYKQFLLLKITKIYKTSNISGLGQFNK